MAKDLYLAASPKPTDDNAQRLEWAALLHEVGFSVSPHRISQARRVHPRERGHARASPRRSSVISRSS
jgi:hypothetical protein